jgi:nucleotide-binding universal stress UspA family protein
MSFAHDTEKEACTRAPDRTSPVVLALRGGEFPGESLKRADALAEAMGVELRIVRVVDPYPVLTPSMRLFNARDAARALDELTKLREATCEWFESALGHALSPGQLEVVRGDFVEITCERALELAAALVVIAPSRRLLDSNVESLATRSGLPILIARSGSELDPCVVAATDLEDARFPVLRAAAQLAQVLGAAVVPVHNVCPLPAMLRGAAHHPSALRERAAWLATAKERKQSGLARAVGELELSQAGVISDDYDAARAILHEARSRKADLVVVGLRTRSWIERLLSPSVATSVVRGARRSVLITPLSQPEAMRA